MIRINVAFVVNVGKDLRKVVGIVIVDVVSFFLNNMKSSSQKILSCWRFIPT